MLDVRIGFMPSSHAIADDEHPGLMRAGERASAPYVRDNVEHHICGAVDLCGDDTVRPDLIRYGFDTVDLSQLDPLQQAFARIRDAGHMTEADASVIRTSLDGATLRSAGAGNLTVLHLADEGLIMRQSGPNGLSVVGPTSTGMNGHSAATSVHADQDVYGTPLTQLMDGRAPSLFRHDSPDGRNSEAALMLVNLWIPLQQLTQPLVLADGRSVDRRRHQLRYGLATESFLERDDDTVINDIWTFLHDPAQRWFLRSEMDHRSAYVFDTLSTPHGSCTLPGEDVAEQCYLGLQDAEEAAAAGDTDVLAAAASLVAERVVPAGAPPALGEAIAAMLSVAHTAATDPGSVCGDARAGRRPRRGGGGGGDAGPFTACDHWGPVAGDAIAIVGCA